MLTVLFIYCDAQQDVGTWVMGVEAVLAPNGCSILQVALFLINNREKEAGHHHHLLYI